MARKLRVLFAGAIYHLMFRGNGRPAIFKDDRDRERLLRRLAKTAPWLGVKSGAAVRLLLRRMEKAPSRINPKSAKWQQKLILLLGDPKVPSRILWSRLWEALLSKEKRATRERDALNAERRRLPMVRSEKEYTFFMYLLRSVHQSKPALVFQSISRFMRANVGRTCDR